MAAVAQRLSVTRGIRTVDTIQATVDGGDTVAMGKILEGWLEGRGWDRGLWNEFRLVSFEPYRREVQVLG